MTCGSVGNDHHLGSAAGHKFAHMIYIDMYFLMHPLQSIASISTNSRPVPWLLENSVRVHNIHETTCTSSQAIACQLTAPMRISHIACIHRCTRKFWKTGCIMAGWQPLACKSLPSGILSIRALDPAVHQLGYGVMGKTCFADVQLRIVHVLPHAHHVEGLGLLARQQRLGLHIK